MWMVGYSLSDFRTFCKFRLYELKRFRFIMPRSELFFHALQNVDITLVWAVRDPHVGMTEFLNCIYILYRGQSDIYL